jgi:acyl carrier protein
MTISSRTPEGVPGNCPLCDAVICLEPSGPVGDAPCPYCGSLLWFVRLAGQVQYYPLDEIPATKRQKIYNAIAGWAAESGFDLTAIHELDSFDLAQLFLQVESELGVTISEKAARKMRTLGDVIDYLVRDRDY